jgi:3-methyladenine DNA glycosylase AlkC
MDKVLLKDQALNRQRITQIAQEIKRVYPSFDSKDFIATVLDRFPELELKARIAWVSECFKKFLPAKYDQAVAILLQSLPLHDDATHTGTDFGIFTYAPYSDFVAKHGCTKEHLQLSFQALKEMTKHYSAEDAVRFFINAFPDETMAELQRWSKDEDYHVRRLASEGTRPILPWSPRITTPPEAALPILDNLFFDSKRFVIMSVANHLNDISRTNPELVLNTLERWHASGKQSAREMDFITRQALRALIKTGHPATFEFLQFSTDPKITISGIHISSNPIQIGGWLEFTFAITAQKDERLLIDYVIYFPNKAGNGHNTKIFKLKTLSLNKGQSVSITKRQPMRDMSTRKLRAGAHRLEVQVNGKKIATTDFELLG